MTNEELLEVTTPLPDKRIKEESIHNDYNHAVETILLKLKGGKSLTEINQGNICDKDDLLFLEEQKLVFQRTKATRTNTKIIWYPQRPSKLEKDQ